MGDWVAVNDIDTIKSTDKDNKKKNLWLFDIKSDYTENHDLSASHPDIVMKLLERLAYYNTTAVKCVYSRDPNAKPAKGHVWGPWL